MFSDKRWVSTHLAAVFHVKGSPSSRNVGGSGISPFATAEGCGGHRAVSYSWSGSHGSFGSFFLTVFFPLLRNDFRGLVQFPIS